MTDNRANAIAEIFNENYERAKTMGAFNQQVALVAAAIYTIDDLIHDDEKHIVMDASLGRKVQRMKEIMDKWKMEKETDK